MLRVTERGYGLMAVIAARACVSLCVCVKKMGFGELWALRVRHPAVIKDDRLYCQQRQALPPNP